MLSSCWFSSQIGMDLIYTTGDHCRGSRMQRITKPKTHRGASQNTRNASTRRRPKICSGKGSIRTLPYGTEEPQNNHNQETRKLLLVLVLIDTRIARLLSFFLLTWGAFRMDAIHRPRRQGSCQHTACGAVLFVTTHESCALLRFASSP